jgi:uncharacterized paraquat-inducible protein A
MPAAEFACPKCKTAFSVEPGRADLAAKCPTCASELEAHFYPAFFRPMDAGLMPAALIDQADAGCFYHPQKQAAHVCDGCGRLICSLCSIDMGAEHLCPSCISSGKKKGKLPSLDTSCTRYDSITLILGVMCMFTSFFSLILAPAAIYIAVRHWKSPQGLTRFGHARMVIGLLLAVGFLLLWGTLFGAAILAAAGAHPHPRHHS